MKARPLTPLALAWANLRRRPARAGSLCFLVALFAFALLAAALVNAWLRAGLSGLSGRMGADILIVPYGYEKKLEGALLRGEPSAFYTKAELADKIRAHDFVAAASPQLFLTSLSTGCCSVKVQLVGFDPATDFSVGPWLRSRRPGRSTNWERTRSSSARWSRPSRAGASAFSAGTSPWPPRWTAAAWALTAACS